LARELAQARQRHEPLVVMVSLPNCPFCRISRQSHLNPMWKAGMPIVQVDMRSDAMTEDFDGKPVTHDQMARRWQIKVAPTLLFIGAGGKEVAERMQGTYLPDFYGPYLQERLQQARQGL
jgi:thioredoxin-related protein